MVAEEKGYFRDEGLTTSSRPRREPDEMASGGPTTSVRQRQQPSTEDAVRREARRLETMEAGRTCDISAATGRSTCTFLGRTRQMWGHAYSVTPAGIYVAPESSIRVPMDLAGTPWVSATTGQSLLGAPGTPEESRTRADRGTSLVHRTPNDRVQLSTAASRQPTFSAGNPIRRAARVSESGRHRSLIGFHFCKDVDMEDVDKYFRALRQRQRDIDGSTSISRTPTCARWSKSSSHWSTMRAFGPGERIIFGALHPRGLRANHRWMKGSELFPTSLLTPTTPPPSSPDLSHAHRWPLSRVLLIVRSGSPGPPRLPVAASRRAAARPPGDPRLRTSWAVPAAQCQLQ